MQVCSFLFALASAAAAAAAEATAGRGDEGVVLRRIDSLSEHDHNLHAARILPPATEVGTRPGKGSPVDRHRREDQGVLKGHQSRNYRSFCRRDAKAERSGRGGWRQRSVAVRRIRGGCYSSYEKRMPAKEVSQLHEKSTGNVLCYYPNLIGYARVALVLTSYYLAETNWRASSCTYLVAFAGDAVDGYVAKKFNQASRFGSVLDMVTDRCSTAGLLLVLSRLYSRAYSFAFLLLMYVDLFSHWMHTHSVLGHHHKSTSTLRRRNVLIRVYYENLALFGYCCIGAELFYVLLYLLHFWPRESRSFDLLQKACYWLCLPACALKQVVNVTQMLSAARTLASEEVMLGR